MSMSACLCTHIVYVVYVICTEVCNCKEIAQGTSAKEHAHRDENAKKQSPQVTGITEAAVHLSSRVG